MEKMFLRGKQPGQVIRILVGLVCLQPIWCRSPEGARRFRACWKSWTESYNS